MNRNDPPFGNPVTPQSQRNEPKLGTNPLAVDQDEALKVENTPVSPDAGYVAPDAGVRSLNKLPAVAIGFAMMVLLGIMLFNVQRDETKQVEETKPDEVSVDSNRKTLPVSNMTDKMFGDRHGVIEGPQPMQQPQELPQQPMPSQQARQESLMMPQEKTPGDPEAEQLRERIKQLKLSSFTAAITSPSSLNFQAPGQTNLNGTSSRQPVTNADFQNQMTILQQRANSLTASAPGSTDAMALYRQRVAQMPGGAAGMGGGSLGGFNNDNMSRPGSQHLLKEQPDDNKWTLDSKVHTPSTPFEILTGTVIPAVMVTGINSDLPGQMIAQVSQNVYDTARGEHLIIPQGTRLIGQYGNSVAYGQERVLVAWNRIVFPDGKSIDIGSMPGATGAGYSGLKDKVNHHYWRLFGSAFLMSMISAGVVYSQDRYADDDDEYGRVTASSAMAEQLANQIGQTAAQLIQRNLTIAPTLEIRPGFRFNVVVTKDMVFGKPYQSFDYK